MKGYTLLAKLGKTRLRPGGKQGTSFLFSNIDLDENTHVLEVACNQATTSIELAKQYRCHITACDQDERVVETARANIHDHRVDDCIKVDVADAMNLPYEADSFDVIINEAMLSMLPGKKKQQCLREYYRVLKPGGVLLTHDIVYRTSDAADQKAIRKALSESILVQVMPLTELEWHEQYHAVSFKKLASETGRMTLMSFRGMLQDEGLLNTLKIGIRAFQGEHREQFQTMRRTLKLYDQKLGYIANVYQK